MLNVTAVMVLILAFMHGRAKHQVKACWPCMSQLSMNTQLRISMRSNCILQSPLS